MRYSKTEMINMDRVQRLHLLNSITGFKSANLIGTKGAAGSNLAVFSSVTHFGSSPAIIGFNLRPTEVPRHTYENILETGIYTINAIAKTMFEKAHQTSGKYPRGVSEFQETGLSEQYFADFEAPYVLESPFKIGMKFLEEHQIQANQTKLIIGEVVEIHFDGKLQDSCGAVDLNKAGVVTISGLDSYHLPKKLKKLGYVRL